MSLQEYFLSFGLAVALGCDAFAVGAAIGTRSPCRRACFRLWFHFGLFQFLMPIIGWNLGQSLLTQAGRFANCIAFAMLFVIAVKALRESLQTEDEEAGAQKSDPTCGWSLVMLSVATSLDALGAGFGMGIAGMQLFVPALIIGVVASVMTWCGLRLGRRLSVRFGKRVETAGAIILFIIAFKLLLM